MRINPSEGSRVTNFHKTICIHHILLKRDNPNLLWLALKAH